MTQPVRLQLSRRKGFNLQAWSRAVNDLPAVKVSRPTVFGNPWTVKGAIEAGYSETGASAWCVELFREWITEDPRSITRLLDGGGEERLMPLKAALPRLRGHNLACFCKPCDPCHADVLLELANLPLSLIEAAEMT